MNCNDDVRVSQAGQLPGAAAGACSAWFAPVRDGISRKERKERKERNAPEHPGGGHQTALHPSIGVPPRICVERLTDSGRNTNWRPDGDPPDRLHAALCSSCSLESAKRSLVVLVNCNVLIMVNGRKPCSRPLARIFHKASRVSYPGSGKTAPGKGIQSRLSVPKASRYKNSVFISLPLEPGAVLLF